MTVLMIFVVVVEIIEDKRKTVILRWISNRKFSYIKSKILIIAQMCLFMINF
jgi:hypothetical protein